MPEGDENQGAIASPLSLLLDAASSGADAAEVLLLSFTLDLGFFEHAALSAAQSLGARVSVVGDAGVVRHDPRAVRRAGRGYLSGLASLGGSFHPKLLVIAGPETATVAIGSGNLTLAGWQDNHELWTVLHAGPDGCPTTIHQVADWLTRLLETVRFSHHVPEVLSRTAQLLAGLGPAVPGPRLVSPVFGPVIDQLPEEHVDELAVCCPFHDPGAVALGQLVDRLRPGRLTVAIQPGLTVCDGPAIAALVDQYGGEVVEVDSNRYRHGKLIEARRGEQRWALTGSANCSAAALLKKAGSGGNIELSLVSTLTESLMPEGTPLGHTTLQEHTYRPRRVDRPSIVVLGATRTDTGLEVLLTRPLHRPGRVELSAPEAQPDTWERIAEVAPDSVTVAVTWGAEGGSRLRVVADSPEGPVFSNVVFLVDPARALRRHGRGDTIRRPTEAFDLFADTGIAEKFVADLEALRAAQITLPRAATAAAAAGSHAGSSTAAHVDHGNWEDYLDVCAGRIGNSLLRFALGLPALPSEPGSWTDTVRAAWDEDLPDDAETGLDSDDADDLAQHEDAPVVARIPSLADRPTVVRNRYRRWAERLAEASSGLGPAERLLALRLVLWIAAAGAWPGPDSGWLATVGKATEALGHAPDPPTDVEPATASLAAVALSVLRSRAPRSQRTPANRIFDRAAEAVSHLLASLETAYVEEYTKLLSDAFGPAAEPESVTEVAYEVVQHNPLADAVRALEDHDIWDAHLHGRVIHIAKASGNPVLPALQAVGLADSVEHPIGAWAGTPDNWALVIWSKPNLVVFTHSNADRWFHYRLTGIYTPRVCAYGDKGIDRRFLCKESFGAQPMSDAAQDALEAVDLTSPAPPDC